MKSKIVIFFLLFLFPELIQAGECNWYEKSFFLLHIDHHTTDKFEVGRDADPVETMRLLMYSKPDVLQIHAKGNPGWTTYPSNIGHVPPLLRRDVMRVWKDISLRCGVPFSAYFNLGRDRYSMEHTPGFNRVDINGNQYDNKLCNNSAVGREYLFPMIREIMSEYHPDGF